MVREEMQRVASSWYGAGNASVGQTSRQARHDPQRSSPGASRGSSSVVKIAPRKNQFPRSRPRRFVCLPCQPSPAAAASGFSITGAVSTKTLISAPVSATSQRPSRFSRALTTSW
jgi:hypothetical protein